MCVVNVYGHVRNAYMHMCVYMPVRLYVCAGIYKKTFEHLQAYIHTHIQRHIHTYIHAYIQCMHTYIYTHQALWDVPGSMFERPQAQAILVEHLAPWPGSG